MICKYASLRAGILMRCLAPVHTTLQSSTRSSFCS
ncbi:hypothetical protein ACP70R_003779 [Stipagrostis hirtigluma subsp. patula]